MKAFRVPIAISSVVAIAVTAVLAVAAGTTAALVGGIVSGWLVCLAVLAWDLGAGLVVTPLCAMGVSLYLAHQHVAVLGGAVSICAVNETFDCDAVNTSPYSELFGIPVALYGAAFYLALAVLAWRRRRGGQAYDGALPLLRLAGIGSVLYSIFLAWVSHAMGTWCLFCISLYGLNLLLLGGAWYGVAHAAPDRVTSLGAALSGRGGDRSLFTAGTAGMVSFILGIMVYEGLRNQMLGGAATLDPQELARYYEPVTGPVELDGTEPIYGDREAPFLVLEWADYECPYCARASEGIKKLVDEHPDIQIRFKHYPISGLCNPFLEGPRHAGACPAAFAAECAHRQGRFWEMTDLLFKNPQYHGEEDILFMARQAGLDMQAFEQCLDSPDLEPGIHDDIRAAKKVGLTGTPLILLRGLFDDTYVEVDGRPERIEALIEAARQGVELIPPSSGS